MAEIEIVEVGPRDGLQNESVLFSTQQKLDMIQRAIDAGVRRIEVASFVNPKLVPQMADAEAVSSALIRPIATLRSSFTVSPPQMPVRS